jgi:C-terminal processing protease CtpA/Prc
MKQLNTGRQWPFALTLVILLTSGTVPAVSEPEVPPGAQLKLDIPKMDTPIKRKPLKGSIQHTLQLKPPPVKARTPQTGNAASNGLAGKATADNASVLKGKAKQDKNDALSAAVQSGIGIIGVKFIMGFGRPPTINRVFPGTPAMEKGLRPNDIIIAVDGIPTFGLTKDEVYNMIIGTPHTPVTISVRRKNDFQVRTMERMDFNDITDPQVRRDYQNM